MGTKKLLENKKNTHVVYASLLSRSDDFFENCVGSFVVNGFVSDARFLSVARPDTEDRMRVELLTVSPFWTRDIRDIHRYIDPETRAAINSFALRVQGARAGKTRMPAL